MKKDEIIIWSSVIIVALMFKNELSMRRMVDLSQC